MPNETKSVLIILGMRSNACREAVAAALERVVGVTEAQVSLYRGLAIVTHADDCPLLSLITAVIKAGYGASMTSLRPSSSLLDADRAWFDANQDDGASSGGDSKPEHEA